MATGDETITLTSFVDERVTFPLDRPVWERLITASYDADDAGAVTHNEIINGILLKIILVIPATTTTGTTSQLLIKDNADATIFDSGELAENATYTFNVFEPLSGTIDIVYEPSAAAGSVETPTITLRGI